MEDPYSCGDSESDLGRVDAEVLRDGRRRAGKSRRSAKREEPTRSRHHSNSSEVSVDSAYVNTTSHRHDKRASKFESECELKMSSSVDVSSSNGDDTADTDEHPPSYSSLKPDASLRKAERNLNRIKRADSVKSGGSGKSDLEHRDSSSSNSSKHTAKRVSKNQPAPPSRQRSATMPRAALNEPPMRQKSDKRSHTLKGGQASRRKTDRVEVDAAVSEKSSKRPSSGGSKRDQKKPSKAGKSVSPSALVVSTDDLLDGSNATLYMPLPEKKNEEISRKSRPPSKQASKSLRKCDSGAQTEITGTLSRKSGKQTPAASQPPPETPPSPTKQAGDLLATMVQYLGLQPPGSSTFQSPVHQNSINAFQQHLNQLSSQPPAASVPPLPPHLSHQIYLAWLGAYYAGAAGTWPPPAPPAFLFPHVAAANSAMPPFEMPLYIGGFQPPHDAPKQQETRGVYENLSYSHQASPFNGTNGVSGSNQYQPFRAEATAKNDSGHVLCQTNYPAYHADSGLSDVVMSQQNKQEPPSRAEEEVSDDDSEVAEVAVSSNHKNGLMVYVRSQSTSRTSSTAGTRDSVESLNASDPHHHSPGATSRNSALSRRSNTSDRNKTSTKARKSTAWSRDNTSAGERMEPPNSCANVNNRKHSVNSLGMDSESGPRGSDLALPGPQVTNRNDVLNDTTASHEEMILSLRRAPLATMDDDCDTGLMSSSHASSCSSLTSNRHSSHHRSANDSSSGAHGPGWPAGGPCESDQDAAPGPEGGPRESDQDAARGPEGGLRESDQDAARGPEGGPRESDQDADSHPSTSEPCREGSDLRLEETSFPEVASADPDNDPPADGDDDDPPSPESTSEEGAPDVARKAGQSDNDDYDEVKGEPVTAGVPLPVEVEPTPGVELSPPDILMIDEPTKSEEGNDGRTHSNTSSMSDGE